MGELDVPQTHTNTAGLDDARPAAGQRGEYYVPRGPFVPAQFNPSDAFAPQPFDAGQAGPGGWRPVGPSAAFGPGSAGMPAPGIQPAHPLPAVRLRRVDYDRYIEQSNDKFQIFSAENRRRQKRLIGFAVAGIVLLVGILIWVIATQV